MGAAETADVLVTAFVLPEPGPGAGSLWRLHADKASAQKRAETRRTDGMCGLANGEARLSSRGLLGGVRPRPDNLPRRAKKSPLAVQKQRAFACREVHS